MAGPYVFVRRGGGGGGAAPGEANFRKDIEPGIAQSTLLTATVDEAAGFAVEQYSAILNREQDAGLAVETFASGTSNNAQDAGIGQGSVLVQNSLPEGLGGFEQRHFINFTGTRTIGSATNIGPDNWTNVTNAQGSPNGSNATRSGQALAATDAQIRGVIDDINTTKDVLTIDQVRLLFYVQQAGTTLNNGGLSLEWRIGSSGGWTNLATYTNNQNFLSTPDAHDITGSISSWGNIRDIEVRVRFQVALGTTLVNAACDAVELVVDASFTE